jgi:hypothetical protein
MTKEISTRYPEVVTLLKQGKTYKEIQIATDATYNAIARVKEEIGMKPVGGRTVHPLTLKRNSQISNEAKGAIDTQKNAPISKVTTSETTNVDNTSVSISEKRAAALERGRMILAENREKAKANTSEKSDKVVSSKDKKTSQPTVEQTQPVRVQMQPITVSTQDVSIVIDGSTITTIINGIKIDIVSNNNTLTTTVNGVSFSVNV